MRDNPNVRRQRGIRDPHQRAWDAAERVAMKADCRVWIEVLLNTYDQILQEFTGFSP